MERKVLFVRIGPDEHAAVVALANADNMPVSQFVARLVRAGLIQAGGSAPAARGARGGKRAKRAKPKARRARGKKRSVRRRGAK